MMKNMKIWLILITMAFTLTACGSASNVASVTVAPQSSTGALGDGQGSYTLDISVKDSGGKGVASQLISLEVSTVNTGAIINPVGTTNFSVEPANMRTDANGFLTIGVTHTRTSGELIYIRAVSEGGVKSAWQSLDFAAT
ncbi:MAG: hypothetical protein R8M45_11070, partial [Ghiorsea sp.]